MKGGDGIKEQKIINLLKLKDENGMKELLIRYGPLMRYIIAPILPNEQDAEDCLSEAAMQIWNKIELYEPKLGSWSAWLTAVTRNQALNYKRGNKIHSSLDELEEEIPSQDAEPEEQFIKNEQISALRRALNLLSEKDRILFYRKYYYLQSTVQIASEMGMTERAVEGKLYRIKKQLRKMLGGERYE